MSKTLEQQKLETTVAMLTDLLKMMRESLLWDEDEQRIDTVDKVDLILNAYNIKLDREHLDA